MASSASHAAPSPDESCDQDHDETDMAEKQKITRIAAVNEVPTMQTVKGSKPASNAKDPLRPRRKKARRACYACQRAHLTCGDERPCQRCVKRGLQDACHDGVRKKAKYLNDMPKEMLAPGVGGHYPALSGHSFPNAAYANFAQPASGHLGQNMFPQTQQQHQQQQQQHPLPPSPRHNHHQHHHHQQQQQQQQQATYNAYRQVHPVGLLPQTIDSSVGDFTSPTTSITPPFTMSPGQKSMPMSNVANSASHTPTITSPGGHLVPAIYDNNDPLFNLDLTSLNFVNQYGALELGMLGHMSSGILEPSMKDMKMTTPSIDSFGSVALPGDPLYNDAPNQSDILNDGGLKSRLRWQNDPYAIQGVDSQVPSDKIISIPSAADHLNIPLGFTIDTGSDDVLELISALDSTETAGSAAAHNLQQSHSPSSRVAKQQMGISQPVVPATQPQAQAQVQAQREQQQQQQQSVSQEQTDISDARLNATLSTFHAQNTASRKRRLDASSVYETVKTPYSYINGFHNLIIFLQKNFSRQKMGRIAKALASIRPSFIACTQHLNGLDLVYMEKCFQRTLCEYEDFINKNCTPTIICRRTGEVAAVSREFTSLTGWRKEVLLGKEPNRNIRMGGHDANGSSDSAGAGTGIGTSDSRMRNDNGSSGSGSGSGQSPSTQPETRTAATQQSVFLAELLDEDSVIRFYEDFAHVAFSDSRGSVMTPCKLLRYRTKDDIALNDATTSPGSSKAAKIRSDTTGVNIKTLGPTEVDNSRSRGFPKSSGDTQNQNSPYENNSNGSSGCSTANTSMADISMTNNNNNNNTANLSNAPAAESMPKPGPGNLIPGESGLRFLGDDQGRVDCMLCWTIKRDMFEVPMLIVMNFLPRI